MNKAVCSNCGSALYDSRCIMCMRRAHAAGSDEWRKGRIVKPARKQPTEDDSDIADWDNYSIERKLEVMRTRRGHYRRLHKVS